MAKNWETEILTSLGMTVGEVGGWNLTSPFSTQWDRKTIYKKYYSGN